MVWLVMAIDSRNWLYDSLEPSKGGLASLGGSPTGQLPRGLGGVIPAQVPGSMMTGPAGIPLPPQGSYATGVAAEFGGNIPPSVAQMPLDILRPAGAKGAGGKFISRRALGSLFQGSAGTPLPKLGKGVKNVSSPMELVDDITGERLAVKGTRGAGGKFLNGSDGLRQQLTTMYGDDAARAGIGLADDVALAGRVLPGAGGPMSPEILARLGQAEAGGMPAIAANGGGAVAPEILAAAQPKPINVTGPGIFSDLATGSPGAAQGARVTMGNSPGLFADLTTAPVAGAVPNVGAAATAAGTGGFTNVANATQAWRALDAGKGRALLGLAPEAGLGATAMRGLGVAAPTLTGMSLMPLGESLGDSVDDSGLLGDIGEGAMLGGGIGGTAGMAGGPFAPISVPGGLLAGAIGGGVAGAVNHFIGGDDDKGPSEDDIRAGLRDYTDQYKLLVNQGVITEAERQQAVQSYNNYVTNPDWNMDPTEAVQAAYGPLEQKVAYAMSPEGQLMSQLQAAQAQEQAQFQQAQQFAAQAMEPIAAQQSKIYSDLAAVRDQRFQDPNLPADARATLMATAPAIDMANQQAIAAAQNPMAILAQQYQPPDLTDQIMQLYLANLQYGGGGGGMDLSSLIEQGALDGSQ